MEEDNQATTQTEDYNDTERHPADSEYLSQVENGEEQTTSESTPGTPHHGEHTKQSLPSHFKSWYLAKKKLSMPATVILLLAVLAAIPFTRFNISGIFLGKKDVAVYLVSDKSSARLYNATVTIDGKPSGAQGHAPYPYYFKDVSFGTHHLIAKAGNHKTFDGYITINIQKTKLANRTITLTATGRVASINVKNIIDDSFVKNAKIKYKNYEANTYDRGLGSLVVGPTDNSVEVEVSASGYVTKKQTINTSENYGDVTQVIQLTPAGKVYFLSKKSGKIDVIKTNLDGTDRQTVLAGTGKEDDFGTVMLASRDWKYLALLSKRDSGKAKLYSIDTSNDSLTTMDEGNADFSLIGWQGHSFVYLVNRSSVQYWQPKGQALKSFNAETSKLTTIDQNDGVGNSQYDYVREYYGSYFIFGDKLLFTKYWNANNSYNTDLNGKKAVLVTVKTDGSERKTVKSFDQTAGSYIYTDAVLAEPNEVYLHVSQNGSEQYFSLSNGTITEKTKFNDDYNRYISNQKTYLQSPSGKKTFWKEERDGKDVLFVGDENGENGKIVATLSEFSNYGWYSDNYLLVSKKGSELYVIPSNGLGANQSPLKVSDYHKPSQNYYGYGGGYGGL